MKPTDFSVLVTRFLTQYLAGQRNLSSNTIKAYRDVWLSYVWCGQGVRLPERLW